MIMLMHGIMSFGPTLEIFPAEVVRALELFKQKFNIEENPFPVEFYYFSNLFVSWIKIPTHTSKTSICKVVGKI